MVGSTPTPIAPTSPWIGFCPVGYSLLHNKCYRVFNQAVNWTTARTICQQEGPEYDLASVQSDEENGKYKSHETSICHNIRIPTIRVCSTRRPSSVYAACMKTIFDP